MLPRMGARWLEKQDMLLTLQSRVRRKGSLITMATKIFGLTIQSLALVLGAYFVVCREISPGIVVAGSI